MVMTQLLRQFKAVLFSGLSACLIAAPAVAHAQAPAAASAPRHAHTSLGTGVAVAPSGEIWIVGVNEKRQLFVQRRLGNGRLWQTPQVLDTGDDVVAADGENRPKLAFGPNLLAVITYTNPLAKPYTGQIRMLRSIDGGRTFSAPFTVHHDRQVITHRFESVGFDARGVLHTVWIDKRDLTDAAGKPVPGYRGAAVYRNESTNGGKSFGPDIKLADHTCECCRIALAPSPNGRMVAMWRHVFAPSERDHAFAELSGNAPAEPVRATLDRWALNACPHHGPGLAPAAGGGYHTVWFGDRAGVAQVRYGQLDDQGAPRGTPMLLPDERAEHADVASAGNRVAVVWRSYDGEATRWRAWLSTDSGRSFTLKELGRSAENNDHPRLVQHGQQIHALWRTATGVFVETLFP
ncbi:MAG: hypothetical protein RLZZ618_1427 [Pseudomonadota bacterium]|jgi:hypothetical protein